GAAGPILNHMDKEAVKKYLNHMSDTIQKKTGPLSNHLRAFFTDSMELEGCNWSADLADEFGKRRGYDLMPYLPFTMFKVGRLGAVVDENYGVKKSPEFEEIIRRVRFDFEYTKAELLYERFTQTYLEWCREQNVKSRAQAYGRGFFPLETSLGYDIPEGESWTTNWLRHKLGEEMSDEDYRRGRGYTMINKYVSSAAHLTGKRLISCEEMTNTYLVFNATL
ncbi:MAG TPA: glycosyl hydrolase, partial [Petrimonas sp.]|nr:glycosyl hydrolase [Petrimonas sp.]